MLRDSAKRRLEKISFFSSTGKYSVYPYSSTEYYQISQHFLPDRFNLSRYTLELERNRTFSPSKGETTEVDGSMVGYGAVERWKRKRERKSNSNLDPYSRNNLGFKAISMRLRFPRFLVIDLPTQVCFNLLIHQR